MERLLKYCLSFVILSNILYSCDTKSALDSESKRHQAEKVYKKAIRYYQGTEEFQNGIIDAIHIDSTYDEAIRELSIAYLKRGYPHEWKKRIDKAVELNPIIWQGYRGYNYLWFYRDYKRAIADFDATDTLNPNFIDQPQGHSVDYWRGIAYLGLKDYKNSLHYFNKYIDTETKEWGEDIVEVTGFLYRGIALYDTGKYDKALEDFDKLLKYNRGQSADSKYYKALILKNTEPSNAKSLIASAIVDFKNGYYNQRPYVETLRQIYLEDLENLQKDLLNQTHIAIEF